MQNEPNVKLEVVTSVEWNEGLQRLVVNSFTIELPPGTKVLEATATGILLPNKHHVSME